MSAAASKSEEVFLGHSTPVPEDPNVVAWHLDDAELEEMEREVSQSRLVSEPIEDRGTPFPYLRTIQAHALAQRLVGSNPLDLLFFGLRLVVFQVDPRSATPISRLMYQGMSKKEVEELFEDFDEDEEDKMVGVSKNEDFEWKWAKVEQMLLVEPPSPKIREAIDKYRAQYSEKLRDADLRDIDVLYSGDAGNIKTFKIDQEKIIRAGGKLYSRFSTKHEQRTIGLSTILSAETLEKIFPPDRENVKIVVNTPPAGPTAERPPPKWYGKDSISQSMHPKYVALGPNPLFGLERASNEVLAEICAELNHSDSFQQFLKAKRVSWYTFPSILRKDPNWSAEEHPLSQDIPFSDDAWWQPDAELRYVLINEWMEKSIARDISNLQDQVDSEEYFVPALCNTYTADANHQWHYDNIDVEAIKKAKKRLLTAEWKYKVVVKNCKKAKETYQKAQDHVRQEPDNAMARMVLQDITDGIISQEWDERLCMARKFILQLRKIIKKEGELYDTEADLVRGIEEFKLELKEDMSYEEALKLHNEQRKLGRLYLYGIHEDGVEVPEKPELMRRNLGRWPQGRWILANAPKNPPPRSSFRQDPALEKPKPDKGKKKVRFARVDGPDEFR